MSEWCGDTNCGSGIVCKLPAGHLGEHRGRLGETAWMPGETRQLRNGHSVPVNLYDAVTGEPVGQVIGLSDREAHALVAAFNEWAEDDDGC